ncbi:MAG TPA: hypothetical protein VFW00_10410 [Rhodocyclaceae bacterium]|nr:hypothetical protein [Rhodocyclaceae bacterium]
MQPFTCGIYFVRIFFVALCLTQFAAPAQAAASTTAKTSVTTPPIERFQIGLWGNMPYGRNGDGTVDGPKILALTQSMNTAKLAFTIFDGNTKDDSTPCTDQVLGADTLRMFNRLEAPAIYALGDSEWTNCHHINNGSYNALERLDFLRKTLYATDTSLGIQKLKVDRQGAPGLAYSENARWEYGSIVFTTLNVPGHNNNKVDAGQCPDAKSTRKQADCDQDNAEYVDRNRHNLAWLGESFEFARYKHAAGIMIVMQADPGFDLPETENVNERTATPNMDGYKNLLDFLATQSRNFAGQVVLVHGGTRFFKIDKPLLDQAHMIRNFTRVETFGSPNLHWVRATIDLKSPDVFNFEQMIVPGN